MSPPLPKRCRWCDHVMRVLKGALVCPRCDHLTGAKQAGAVA